MTAPAKTTKPSRPCSGGGCTQWLAVLHWKLRCWNLLEKTQPRRGALCTSASQKL